jgi:hypothetical protein
MIYFFEFTILSFLKISACVPPYFLHYSPKYKGRFFLNISVYVEIEVIALSCYTLFPK